MVSIRKPDFHKNIQYNNQEDIEKFRRSLYNDHMDIVSFLSSDNKKEDNRKQLYTDKLEVHIIELPKLMKNQYAETQLLNWAKFMGAERKEELMEMAEKNEYLGKAYDKLVVMSEDKEKRLEYEAREKAIRDYNHQMSMNYQQGVEDGIEQGIEKGIQQGHGIYNRLIQKLLEDNRIDVLEQAVKNPKRLAKLFEEYNL